MTGAFHTTVLVLLALSLGVVSIHDYIHASHLDEHFEEASEESESQHNDDDTDCDCSCVCHNTLLFIDYLSNHDFYSTSSNISIQIDFIPPSPIPNPPERPPQAV